MNPLLLAALIALILALVDELRARGQAITTWAVVILCIGILWGHVFG